jgi:serine/threonine protein kinase
VGCQILDILAEAHARGVLHRRISEDEVIVTPEGRAVLNGFGSRRMFFVPRVPPPPEQLAGELYTARSDLYAVGALLRRLAFAGALQRSIQGPADSMLSVHRQDLRHDAAAGHREDSEGQGQMEAPGPQAPRRVVFSRVDIDRSKSPFLNMQFPRQGGLAGAARGISRSPMSPACRMRFAARELLQHLRPKVVRVREAPYAYSPRLPCTKLAALSI